MFKSRNYRSLIGIIALGIGVFAAANATELTTEVSVDSEVQYVQAVSNQVDTTPDAVQETAVERVVPVNISLPNSKTQVAPGICVPKQGCRCCYKVDIESELDGSVSQISDS